MKWYKILDGRCPKCDRKLLRTGNGLECPMNKPGFEECKFFITHAKAHALKAKIKEDRYKRRMDCTVQRV